MSQERISFGKIVYALNKDELKEYCNLYGINTANIDTARNLTLYRNNLIKKMAKEAKRDDVSIATFHKKIAPALSHETIIEIYPQYDNYKQELKLKKEQRKFNKENEQQEADYEKAYEDYYTSPHKPEPSTVHKIEFIDENEMRR